MTNQLQDTLSPRVAEHYTIEKHIGEGEWSHVYKGYSLVDNSPVVIKHIRKPCSDPQVQQEIEILNRLKTSRYFSELYQVFSENHSTFLILEYIPGSDLFQYLEQFPHGIPEYTAIPIIRQVVEALVELHEENIVHLDIKLENIVYNPNTNSLKIIDFGFGAVDADKPIKACRGSMHYICPQVCMRIPFDGKKADVWAVGVLSYALLCFSYPFDAEDSNKLSWLIKRAKVDYPRHLSASAVKFLQAILNPVESTRPSAQSLLTHPFLILN